MFGFNTANLAMIISESLRIPTIGFILQPTVIPSKNYPAIVPIGRRYHVDPRASQENISKLRASQENLQMLDSNSSVDPPDSTPPSRNSIASEPAESSYSDEEDSSSSAADSSENWSYFEVPNWWGAETSWTPSQDNSHFIYGILKNVAENNIFTGRLNSMRAAHGLPPMKNRETDFQALTRQDVPLIVPINEFCFGGRPPDWSSSLIMTDFIYLSSSIPPGQNGIDLLAPDLKSFILRAKEDGKPLVVIAFSSMPIGRTAVLGLSALVAEQSARGARVIAVVGVRPRSEVTHAEMEKRAALLKQENKLIEIAAAPFSILFPLCDFLVVHGGLGSTSEAFRAGKPLMVTGVLVLDQRFWGRRVAELGVGPDPCQIRKLPKVFVQNVDFALTPGNHWAENAKVVSKMLAGLNHGDGIALTSTAMYDAVQGRAKIVAADSV